MRNWGLCFVICGCMATAMLAAHWSQSRGSTPVVSRPKPVAPSPTPARAPKSLTMEEIEVITHGIRMGDLAALNGKLDEARRHWSKAREAGQGVILIHETLGYSYFRNKLYDEALKELDTVESLIPAGQGQNAARVRVGLSRAEVLTAQGKEQEALYILAMIFPQYQTGAMIQGILEKSRERAARLQLLDTLASENPNLYAVLYDWYRRENRTPDAAVALYYLARQKPWDANLVRQALGLLKQARRDDEFMTLCRDWAKAAPGLLDPWIALGDLHRERGRIDEAVMAYTSIVDLKPGEAGIHGQLGHILNGLGRKKEALAQFGAAKKLRPDDRSYDHVIQFLTDPAKRIEQSPGGKLRGDLKIVMVWDTQTDIDLYITDPSGAICSYQHMKLVSGGALHEDVQNGFGPEIFTLEKAAKGKYAIEAKYCSGNGRTNAVLTVILHEGTPYESRTEHTVVLEHSGEIRSVPAVDIR